MKDPNREPVKPTSVPPASSSAQRVRFDFIDMARLYGVTLVYYGHIIESYMKAGSSVAAVHYKFIYSFHMPLFFILAGYVAKTHPRGLLPTEWARHHLTSRLVPYLFLSLLLIIPTFWTTDFTAGLVLPSVDGYVKGIAVTILGGFPYFNIPTWFLVCLFMVEFYHYCSSRLLTSNTKVLLIAFGFYLFGTILAWNAHFLRPTNMLAPHGKIYPYFMILEAFTGYSLYLVGVFLRRNKFLAGTLSPFKGVMAALACLFLVFLSYDLNKGMSLLPFHDAVLLAVSSHGNPILFPLTALIGTLMILLLAKLTSGNRFLCYLGGNTLIIFGLNGVFYHLINDRLAEKLLFTYGDHAIIILVSGSLITLASIVLTIPFVVIFSRYIPQLIGKPQLDGPIMRRLV
ncbi:MAG: hypothetical protein D6B25_11745 [Desulfobulbaceae bacterium]|nr:MAG: hypothetical protein D6B25_11745 [Desulfobulbaceae bacterium]